MPIDQNTFETARIVAVNTHQQALAAPLERHGTAMEQARRDWVNCVLAAEAAFDATNSGGDETAARAAGDALCALRTAGPDFEAVRHQLNQDIEAADAARNATMAELRAWLAAL